uniref:PDZ domain-containing protein n=1 Tax=Angiostrongylus cantonensis TaxID=6313 RepID=A0A0K0DK32_ANGCA
MLPDRLLKVNGFLIERHQDFSHTTVEIVPIIGKQSIELKGRNGQLGVHEFKSTHCVRDSGVNLFATVIM